jgi:hypothetical protein
MASLAVEEFDGSSKDCLRFHGFVSFMGVGLAELVVFFEFGW